MAGDREWLTAKEVAVLKDVSVQAVTAACRPPNPRLPSVRSGGTWLIRREDAEKWEPRKPKKK